MLAHGGGMEKLKLAYGNWVTGDRFWDRQEEIELFRRKTREGAHLLIVAQRRMGKTSLMKEAALRLANEFECVFVDFQNAATPQDAIADLSLALQNHKSLWQKTRELFANVLDVVEKIGNDDIAISLRAGLAGGNWSTKGDELCSILAGSDKPVLLLMDEVPILVNRIIKGEDYKITPERRRVAGEFMSWLRKNSLRFQGKIRMVISGSIGFEPVLRQANLSGTINNFVPFELKPWDEETAINCLRALANQYVLEYRDGAEQEMVRLLGCCIPNHVQMFFDHAQTFCLRKKISSLGPKEVIEVYQNEMLSTRGHAELTHYEERLKLILGTEKIPLALDMITEAAISSCLSRDALERLQQDHIFENESTADVQKEILWILEHDGYLTQVSSGYTFVSKLLRDWWIKRYQMFFIPVSERGR
jgi:uncharacterized protein